LTCADVDSPTECSPCGPANASDPTNAAARDRDRAAAGLRRPPRATRRHGIRERGLLPHRPRRTDQLPNGAAHIRSADSLWGLVCQGGPRVRAARLYGPGPSRVKGAAHRCATGLRPALDPGASAGPWAGVYRAGQGPARWVRAARARCLWG
jgi:hypothetical protein